MLFYDWEKINNLVARNYNPSGVALLLRAVGAEGGGGGGAGG